MDDKGDSNRLHLVVSSGVRIESRYTDEEEITAMRDIARRMPFLIRSIFSDSKIWPCFQIGVVLPVQISDKNTPVADLLTGIEDAVLAVIFGHNGIYVSEGDDIYGGGRELGYIEPSWPEEDVA